MTRRQLLESMSSAEYAGWIALYTLEGTQAQQGQLQKDAVRKLQDKVKKRKAKRGR